MIAAAQLANAHPADPDLVAVVLDQEAARPGRGEPVHALELAVLDERGPFGGGGVRRRDQDAVQPVLEQGPAGDDTGLVELAPGQHRGVARGDDVVQRAGAMLPVLRGGGGVEELELRADGLLRIGRDAVLQPGVPGDAGLPLEGELEVSEQLARREVTGASVTPQDVPLEAPALRDLAAAEGLPVLRAHERGPPVVGGRGRGPFIRDGPGRGPLCAADQEASELRVAVGGL